MLKLLNLIFLSIFLFGFDIDKEIEYILKLPPDKKYIALNKLKQKILKLKEKEREKLIKKLLSHYHINDAPAESIIKGKK